MAVVQGDPEELRALARSIAEFANQASDQLRHVQGRLRDMGDSTWADAQYQRFSAMFEPVADQITRALEELSNDHCAFLEQRAAVLDEYLAGN